MKEGYCFKEAMCTDLRPKKEVQAELGGSYIIKTILSSEAAIIMDLDRSAFATPAKLDKLKKFISQRLSNVENQQWQAT